MKRGTRSKTEDRWHRPARRGETVPWPADDTGPGTWCTDPKHGQPGTLVTTVRHGRGLRWQARWVDHDGNERSEAFARKAEADRCQAAKTTAIHSGTYADPLRGAVPFRTVAEQWFDAKGALGPKTVAGYRSLLDVVILPKWGDVKLRDIDHAAVQTWVSWLANDPAARQRPLKADDGTTKQVGLSPARVIQAFQVVDQVLRYAVRTKHIGTNPADDVQLPRKTTPEKIALTHTQVRTLADAAGELATMVYVLAYGGLRYGECAALKVGDVDVTKRRLRVSRSITYVTGKGHVEGGTKTHAARNVPIPEFVAERLATALEGREPGERVFPNEDGGPMPLDSFRWRFDIAAAIAGLTGITPHSLRHTAGSLALASGATVVTVQRLLGHQSATTTLNVYSHLMPDDFDDLAAAMDKAARAVAN